MKGARVSTRLKFHGDDGEQGEGPTVDKLLLAIKETLGVVTVESITGWMNQYGYVIM